MFGYPDPGRRFTMGLGSIVYDVLDDYIVHASFQRYLASERSAALEHLHNLEDLNIYQNRKYPHPLFRQVLNIHTVL